jgi:hypothetical protein
MNSEKLIIEIIAASPSRSQKGDVAQQLLEQGFFDDDKSMADSLKKRDKLPGGNPVDIKEDFDKQNKN